MKKLSIPPITEKQRYKKVLKNSPSFIKTQLSTAKDENVVNEPKKPTTKNSFKRGETPVFVSNTTNKIPIKKQPIKFTKSVW